MGRPKLETPSPKCQSPKCRRVARIGDFCKAHAPVDGTAAPSLITAVKPQKKNGKPKSARPTTVDPEVNVPVEPDEDAVITLSSTEAESWGRLLAEVTTQKQAAQIVVLKQREAMRQHEALMADFERRRKMHVARASEVNGIYEQVTSELCDKYSLDRKYAVIDVEGRTIREERPSA